VVVVVLSFCFLFCVFMIREGGGDGTGARELSFSVCVACSDFLALLSFNLPHARPPHTMRVSLRAGVALVCGVVLVRLFGGGKAAERGTRESRGGIGGEPRARAITPRCRAIFFFSFPLSSNTTRPV
jgi:hypothetical protein